MNHHCVGLAEQLVQALAAVGVNLDDLGVHIVGHRESGSHGRLATTHDDDVVHILIVLLAHNLADIGDILAGGHEIGQVVELQLVQTARDNRVAASLDGHHMIGVVGTAEVFQGLVENLAALAQLDAQQDEGAVVHIPALAHPRQL